MFPRRDLVSLTYISHASERFHDGDLASLVSQSRAANADLNVTGFLIYRNRTFIQTLEGPEAVVRALSERVAADPRHVDFCVLIDERTPLRRFEGWAMGSDLAATRTLVGAGR